MTKSRTLQVELLESRDLPSLFGTPWPDPENLTISFAPDGTPVDNQTSVLSAKLADWGINATAGKLEILRAFQTWAANANLNFRLVDDGGQPIGSNGAMQGDTRFGDIRMAAKALWPELAISVPYNLISGTRTGDSILSANDTFALGNPDLYDLYSVMLHEAGNILGLVDSSTEPGRVMYGYYEGLRAGLAQADVDALHVLYGEREADNLEGPNGNGSFSTAKNLDWLYLNTPLIPLKAEADVTTLQDVDYYRFTSAFLTSEFTVRVTTGDKSLLMPQLTVYDASHNQVATVSEVSPLDGSVFIRVQNVIPGMIYYAKVQSATQDVFGIGGYHLKVTFGPEPPPGGGGGSGGGSGSTWIGLDNHTNDTLATATTLVRRIFSNSLRFDYTTRASIHDTTDVDFYRVRSSQDSGGSPIAMVVSLWGLEANALYPKASVFNATGQPVSADVLVNDKGSYVIQVLNVTPDAYYYVKVNAADPASHQTGNYFLGVDYRTDPVALSSFATDTLNDSRKQTFRTLEAQDSQVMHFVLSANTGGPPASAAVRMTIYDSDFNPIHTIVAKDGNPVSFNLFLAQGTYHIRFAAGTQTGVPLPALAIELRGARVSDALDPHPVDVFGDPLENPPPPMQSEPYYWWQNDDSFYDPIALLDPYGDPWSPL